MKKLLSCMVACPPSLPFPPRSCYSPAIGRIALPPNQAGPARAANSNRPLTPQETGLMRSSRHSTSVPPSPLDNAFSPNYLARLRERDDVLTAAEAELAGPWKIEPVLDRPGAVAVLRQWEELEAGDPPVAVLWHEETARLLAVLLSIVDRELLFHVEEGATSEGYPLVAVYGEQGP